MNTSLEWAMKWTRAYKRWGLLCNPHPYTPYLEEKTSNVPLVVVVVVVLLLRGTLMRWEKNGSEPHQNWHETWLSLYIGILNRYTVLFMGGYGIGFETSRGIKNLVSHRRSLLLLRLLRRLLLLSVSSCAQTALSLSPRIPLNAYLERLMWYFTSVLLLGQVKFCECPPSKDR